MQEEDLSAFDSGCQTAGQRSHVNKENSTCLHGPSWVAMVDACIHLEGPGGGSLWAKSRDLPLLRFHAYKQSSEVEAENTEFVVVSK